MMTVSRALKTAIATASVVAALSLTGNALAQVQLIPGLQQPEQPAASALSAPAQPRAPSGVAVESLDSVDVEAVGALQPDQRALPTDLWTDLSRGSVIALIDGLPGNWALPAARDLALRLLLSPATIPAAGANDETGAILRARINALLRLGAAAEAAELALVGQDILTSPADLEVLAGTKLAAFDLVGACGDAGRIAPTSQELFWQKLLIFCQAVAGQKEQAALAATTLLDLGVDDPVFFTLIEDISLDLTADLRQLSPEGPLHYAMLRFAEAQLATEPSDPAIAALAVAQSDDLPRAEAALAKGLVDAEMVAEKYRATRFKDSALENPIAVLDRVSVPARRALLFQSIERYEIPALKAEAIAAAIAQSKTDGRLTVAASLFVDHANTIPTSTDLLWFAEDAARLFYLTGNAERGAAWHGLTRTAAGTDPEAAAADSRLWHLAALSGQSGPALARSRQGWAQAVGEASKDPAARLAALMALVEAATGATPAGNDVAARRSAMMLADRPTASPGASPLLLLRLAEAAQAGRIGDTVALALAALAPLDSKTLDLATVTAVVASLQRIGLLAEARRLALEAAVLSEPSGG